MKIDEELEILREVMQFSDSQHASAADWFCPVDHLQFDLVVMRQLTSNQMLFG